MTPYYQQDGKPGPKKGYKQTPEHVAKKKRFGSEHPRWKGDSADIRTGRTRAERYFPVIPPCEVCANPKSERHHKDGNTLNNSKENVRVLCRKCHMESDGRLERFKSLAIKNLPLAIERAAIARKSKTHCPKGHEYSTANTYINRKNARVCRTCINEYKRAKRRMASTGS